jgi:lipoprotein-anchoring transpeptidase ErfK/SrfK
MSVAVMADDSETSVQAAGSEQTISDSNDTQSSELNNTGTAAEDTDNGHSDISDTEGEQKLPLIDGTYIISSAKDGFKVVDHNSSGNVQVGEANGSDSQRYTIKYHEDGNGGYYTIADSDGKYLSVENEGTKSGANAVMLDPVEGALWQRWMFILENDDLFGIKSLFNGLFLDLKNGSTKAGNNIWLYAENRTAAQKFKFTTAGENVVINNGVYNIVSGLDPNKVVDLSGAGMSDKTNVQLYHNSGAIAQKWIINKISGDIYRIYSAASGKVFDVANGGRANGANIWTYSNNNTNAQRWRIRNFGDGSVYFTSVLSGKNIDVSGGNNADVTNIWTYGSNGTNAQKFYLRVSDYKPVEDGTYTIQNKGSKKVVDINDANRQVAANAQMYTSNGTAAQVFRFTRGDDCFYTITSVNSRHVLDVANGSKSNGANIRQYRSNGTDSQKWLILVNSDGTISIINIGSSKAMDVAGNSSRDGANIQQYGFNNTNAQRFVLESATYDESLDSEPIDYSVYQPPKSNIPWWAKAMDSRAAKIYSSTVFQILVDCATNHVGIYRKAGNIWDAIYYWSCATGKSSTPTPKGTFKIGQRGYSFGHGYTCYYWTGFIGTTYLFHSTLYRQGTRTPLDSRLGANLSHGCVRLAIGNAQWIYNNVPSGTTVSVY